VDRSAKKITISGSAIATSDKAVFVVQGSYGLELTGLGAIFSDSATLYGVTRSGNHWLTPYRETAVGTITETKIQKAIDALEENAGSKVNFIVCSWGVRRALASALAQYRQTESMTLEGGFRAISFNGIPVVADRFCPSGTMYLLNTDDFCLHQLCDWQWLEGEDGKILKQKAGKPVYTATLVKYAELICSRPCGQAKLSGITEA
ncbi:MAG: phage major capsid protein, partial [Candidatus Gallimonas sp.]